MNSNYIIRMETPADYRLVEEMTKRAFWNVYVPGCDEHYLTHVMRDSVDFIPELNLVLELEGKIIASVKYLKSRLKDEDGNMKEIVSFGPLCVEPDYQRSGYGKILLEYSFDVAKAMGYEVITNFGDPANYVARGFKSCHKYNVCLEGDVYHSSLLVKELVPGVLDGRKWYFYESPVGELMSEEGFVEFDKTFPVMEKAWRPSQEIFYIQCRSTIGN